jgi:uncharacterized protein (TIGR01777 family)
MRVVIVGGSGLIGRALCSSLAEDNHSVVISSRQPERVTGLPPGACVQHWDDSLCDGADAIVNLAGENIAGKRWTQDRKQRIWHSRIGVGQAVTEAVASAGRKPLVLVQASGVGYYGPSDSVVTEHAPPGHDFLAKLAVEWEASTIGVESLGVRRAIIRTGVVLSNKGGALPRLLLPYRFFLGGPLGDGRQWFPWIHIADEVAAIRFLINNEDARGPFNLAAPHPVTNREFSRVVGRQLRRPALVRTPAFLLRLLFGEMASALLEGQPAVPQRLLDSGYSYQFAEVDSALQDLLRA